jgi:hypothetical protein
MWDPDSVASPDTFTTYAGAALEDDMTYYARARASNGTDWSDWAEASFHMNSEPTAPTLAFPPDGGEVLDQTPLLIVYNADDSEGDSLTYNFAVYSDSAGTIVVDEMMGVTEETDSTSWEVTVPLTVGEEYWWKAQAYDGFEVGPFMPLASFTVATPHVSDGIYDGEARTVFFLGQNVPNPMRSSTMISYGVPGDAESAGRHATLSVYNLNGQLVRRLVDGGESPGTKRVIWDGRDAQGSAISSGVYFYRLTVGEDSATRRLVILK